jgi:protein-S-isoprenylcysteine O-methyltransferase Ste14
MRLNDHFTTTGAQLFRWRSYLILTFVPFLFLTMWQGEQVEAVVGQGFGAAYELICIGLVALGEAIRILTVGFVPRGTSGRNTAGQLAEVLNTTGAYSLVRNPLYLGNCIMYLGVALYSQSLLLALIMGLVLLPYYERIIAAEERFLSAKFGAPYEDWATTVPAFFPRMTGWAPPALPFSWASVIRREHASIFGAIFALYLVELGLHTLGPGDGDATSPLWHAGMAVAVGLELLAIWLKRRTGVLNTAGR